MRKRGNSESPKSAPQDTWDPEQGLGDLKESIQIYRDSFRAASDKPEHYWKRRHAEILERLHPAASKRRFRSALAWAPAALLAGLCLLFFAKDSKAPPKPDLAAGSDEILLINVERALNQEYPEALAPAALLVEERRANVAKHK